MAFELKMEFKNSTSSYLAYAIKLAKKFSYFYESENRTEPNKITLDQNEFAQKQNIFSDLWGVVRNWKGTILLLNNAPIENSALFTYFRIIDCSNQYNNAIIPEEHCFTTYEKKEGWGCKFLSYIKRYIPNQNYYSLRPSEKYWFQFGYFKSENIWEIDKVKLIEVLERESNQNHLSICPVFSFEKAKSIVNELPNDIHLTSNELWEIVYEENDAGTELVRNPVSIKPKILDKRVAINFFQREESSEETITKNIPEVSFEDIGGIDDIIEVIREVIELPIKRPDIFETLGISPHKGIILHGPPGCGKTLIAKAIAHEINAHFVLVKGPELINKYYGKSEENLRKVFEEAQLLQPSIIYFDEIDSIAQERTSLETARLESRFVNQLLTLMDGVKNYGNVCVIGSTNRIELIDLALLRPGRFDYSIEVKKPTLEGCKKIFEIQTKKMPIEPKFDKLNFSKKLFGLTGAEISYVVREGAYNCLRRKVDLRKSIEDNVLSSIDISDFVIQEDDFNKSLESIRKTINC
jgi:SpoVK/Ycf46/Vps4 family AAA+-type ATPase